MPSKRQAGIDKLFSRMLRKAAQKGGVRYAHWYMRAWERKNNQPLARQSVVKNRADRILQEQIRAGNVPDTIEQQRQLILRRAETVRTQTAMLGRRLTEEELAAIWNG